jgi:hypothetical protein
MENNNVTLADFNNATEQEEEFSPDMNLSTRIVWDLLFGSSIFFSIMGNVSVLWIILGKNLFCFNVNYPILNKNSVFVYIPLLNPNISK